MSELLDSGLNNEPKPADKKKILKINLGILALYTVYCFVFNKNEGALTDAVLIVFHVGICFLTAISQSVISKSATAKEWFLSALLVLLIGFGTCVSLLNLNVH